MLLLIVLMLLLVALLQEELVEAKLIKAPSDMGLVQKAAAKGKKAKKQQQKAAGRKQQQQQGSAASDAGGLDGSAGFRRFMSPGGHQVLVGRNNKQNDVLSHQVANPWDLWMHVRGSPGSHAVLRLAKGAATPADEDVQFAADLAAYFSKARDSTKVDVIVTHAEHVKKFKGGKPGQVIVVKESWGGILARPDRSAAALAYTEPPSVAA
jgi:predicted ribosome quality control (RQC) complex YloA/Tae2 family protein